MQGHHCHTRLGDRGRPSVLELALPAPCSQPRSQSRLPAVGAGSRRLSPQLPAGLRHVFPAGVAFLGAGSLFSAVSSPLTWEDMTLRWVGRSPPQGNDSLKPRCA